MAIKSVNGSIKVGYVYECIFGNFKKINTNETTTSKHEADFNAYDYNIPIEKKKKRAVVVVGKFKGLYIVVPISSTEDTHRNPKKTGVFRGFHVSIKEIDLPSAGKYRDSKKRWAKCNLITTVDGGRLRDIFDEKNNCHIPAHKVSEETLNLIKKGILKSIGF